MNRLILLILDSVGIGGAKDARNYGGSNFNDEGANTLAHIAVHFGTKNRKLNIPNLCRLGLAHSCRESCPELPSGLNLPDQLLGGYAYAEEVSRGKDTPSGHWEIAGVPVPFDWSYFPDTTDCFPRAVIEEIEHRCSLPGSLGRCHASGTQIIQELGMAHIESGMPIFYTSADSVFQIACHEKSFGLEKLYKLCESARGVLDTEGLKVGRVIARPFLGESPRDFTRTANRRDYTLPPPSPTVLERLCEQDGQVIGIGKIADIYAHRGITEEIHVGGHPSLWQATLDAVERSGDRTLIMTNFVDFDSLYGHRRDPQGYGTALEEFDAMIPTLLAKLSSEDLLIITADHGNDPTWPGTDHTRENVPILLLGAGVKAGHYYGRRKTFADIGQTVASFFGLPPMDHGTSIL